MNSFLNTWKPFGLMSESNLFDFHELRQDATQSADSRNENGLGMECPRDRFAFMNSDWQDDVTPSLAMSV